MDQWRWSIARYCALLVVGTFAAYGLLSYSRGTLRLMGPQYYDALTGTTQRDTPTIVLEYLRSELREHSWQRPIAMVLSPGAAIALPGFRIFMADGLPKHGTTDKVFVVVHERMLPKTAEHRDPLESRGSRTVLTGVSELLLRSFRDYDFGGWNEKKLNGMVVYSQ